MNAERGMMNQDRSSFIISSIAFMEVDPIRQVIERTGASGEPEIEFIKRAPVTAKRLGVFASSFNPTTVAHVEMMRLAADKFSLDETLALAGKANADKTDYECSLEERLSMMALAFDYDAEVSAGLSSHAYFVDVLEALLRIYPPPARLHFIMGVDTFERVLDPEDKYTARYHRSFSNRREALLYLFSHSRFIVAGRAGRGPEDVSALVAREPEYLQRRVSYIDLPGDMGERSATEVRERLREGLSISGLVPEPVEQYIKERSLYR